MMSLRRRIWTYRLTICRQQSIIWIGLISFGFSLLLFTYLKGPGSLRTEAIIDLSSNYFPSASDLNTGEFLVSSDKCKIPAIDPWNPTILNHVYKFNQRNCAKSHPNVTYVENQMIILNEDALRDLGFTLDDVSCCYKTIERISQNRSHYTIDADNQFKYSEECFRMEKVTRPKSGFVKVTCTGGTLWKSFKHKTYHLIPILANEDSNSLERKLSFWNSCLNAISPNQSDTDCQYYRKTGVPPSILLIGIDSTSRINFRRFLPKTLRVLNSFQAQEMKGYTKVGENTFPNFVPLMTSYSEDELRRVCYTNRWVPQDSCPYLWRKFAQRKYLTAHIEDSPLMAIFNYMKTGFVKPPTDIYPRPFMKAAYKDDTKDNPYTVDCIGSLRPEAMILKYLVDLASVANSYSIPYFFTTWLTDLTHDDTNSLQSADDVISQTLFKLHSTGLLNNTILLLMSDHGYRFLSIRSTTPGWYEDKLPALWIKLPQSVVNIHPDWQEALAFNSRELTTPYDVHETLRDVLSSFSPPSKDELVVTVKPKKRIGSPGGLSLLKKLPTRNCEEAKIPEEYCACVPPVDYSSNDTFIRSAAEAIIHHINCKLPQVCRALSVETVLASGAFSSNGQVLNSPFSDNVGANDRLTALPERLIIGLKAQPGGFLFEAQVTYNKTIDEFTKISNILRMNRVTRSTSCLGANEVAFETLCYCDISLV